MVVVDTDEDRALLRSSRTGLGLLNAMFAEIYCAELANRSDWFHKVSITTTAVLSTAAAASLLQVTAPRAAPEPPGTPTEPRRAKELYRRLP